MKLDTNDVQAEFIDDSHDFYRFRVTVSAISGWQDTGIDIAEGEILRMEHVSGSWNGDGGRYPSHGPAGPRHDAYTAPPGYPLPGVIEDSLVGKIGSEVFFIGDQIRKQARTSGHLYLTINDTGHHDNSGSITMEVSVGRTR